jgi:hypothetical protein
LVELIVLNVGLQAGILSERVFTMFVVMALVTTFLTTPIVTLLYPPWYQHKLELWRKGEIDWDGNPISRSRSQTPDDKSDPSMPLVQRAMVVLNRMEDVPAMMTLTKLLAVASRQRPPPASSADQKNFLKVHVLRLMELTQRTSMVMKVSERSYETRDPLINVFRTFGKLNEVLVSAKMAIVPSDSFSDTVYYQAQNERMQMVILPWTSNLSQYMGQPTITFNDEFIRNVLDKIEGHVGILVDTTLQLEIDSGSGEPSLRRSISAGSLRARTPRTINSANDLEIERIYVQLQEGYRVFFPYFGGRDDIVAFRTVVQLLHCSDVKVTLVKIQLGEESTVAIPEVAHTKDGETDNTEKPHSPIAGAVSSAVHKMVRFPSSSGKLSKPPSIDHRDVSDPDHTEVDQEFARIYGAIPGALKSRLTVETHTTTTPIQYAVKRVKREIESSAQTNHLTIVGRGVDTRVKFELQNLLQTDPRDLLKGSGDVIGKSCLGELGEAMVLGRITGNLLVVQASKENIL